MDDATTIHRKPIKVRYPSFIRAVPRSYRKREVETPPKPMTWTRAWKEYMALKDGSEKKAVAAIALRLIDRS